MRPGATTVGGEVLTIAARTDVWLALLGFSHNDFDTSGFTDLYDDLAGRMRNSEARSR